MINPDWGDQILLNSLNIYSSAKGVLVRCLQNKMSITIPKPLLKGMDREHIRLLDPKCGATENATHFTLTTALTKCNTTRRHTKSSIVYSNTVLEIPLKNNDIITRVREIEIPFSCYYSNKRTATAVGMRPENRKLVFSEKGKGNFTILLELFHNKRFEIHNNLNIYIFRKTKLHSNKPLIQTVIIRNETSPRILRLWISVL